MQFAFKKFACHYDLHGESDVSFGTFANSHCLKNAIKYVKNQQFLFRRIQNMKWSSAKEKEKKSLKMNNKIKQS